MPQQKRLTEKELNEQYGEANVAPKPAKPGRLTREEMNAMYPDEPLEPMPAAAAAAPPPTFSERHPFLGAALSAGEQVGRVGLGAGKQAATDVLSLIGMGRRYPGIQRAILQQLPEPARFRGPQPPDAPTTLYSPEGLKAMGGWGVSEEPGAEQAGASLMKAYELFMPGGAIKRAVARVPAGPLGAYQIMTRAGLEAGSAGTQAAIHGEPDPLSAAAWAGTLPVAGRVASLGLRQIPGLPGFLQGAAQRQMARILPPGKRELAPEMLEDMTGWNILKSRAGWGRKAAAKEKEIRAAIPEIETAADAEAILDSVAKDIAAGRLTFKTRAQLEAIDDSLKTPSGKYINPEAKEAAQGLLRTFNRVAPGRTLKQEERQDIMDALGTFARWGRVVSTANALRKTAPARALSAKVFRDIDRAISRGDMDTASTLIGRATALSGAGFPGIENITVRTPGGLEKMTPDYQYDRNTGQPIPVK